MVFGSEVLLSNIEEFFSKFQKRSKKVEKMILSPMEVVSEGGNCEKVAKKEKRENFPRFQQPE